MQTLQQTLNTRVQTAITQCFGPLTIDLSPLVVTAKKVEFGDFQTNFALPLSKVLQKSPQEIALAVLKHLEPETIFASLEIAGPGFINIRLNRQEVAPFCLAALADAHLGVPLAATPQRVVIDYSSANVAKEMHVGHLRSTVIGDAIARLLTYLGHTVIRQNHLGDWGTQFGMIIQWMLEHEETLSASLTMQALNHLYKQAKQQFDADPEFAARAKQRVVALQSGEATTRALWQRLVTESIAYFQQVYERLGVLLQPQDVRGESSYNADLPRVITELEQANLLTHSDGAGVVFLEGYVDPNNQPVPMIVQKSDGSYLYATTDIAAARYRLRELQADRIIYVTDARQKQHFSMLFSLLNKLNWGKSKTPHRLEHIAFGSILGADRKPYKTREGEVIPLVTLLDEAENKAYALVSEKQGDLPEAERRRIARSISIGAIKYADLSTDRIKDVVFNWERMLAFEGNTAPYLQNAYVRIQAIFRKATVQHIVWQQAAITLEQDAEYQLALLLLNFPECLELIAKDLQMHRLCHYLFDVASSFHRYYEHCPILTAEHPDLCLSRLQLCALTARTLKTGLSLLGIEILDKM